MSKKMKTKKGFNYQASSDLPKLGKIKTEWDLKKLYYKSDKDPEIENDIKATELAYDSFAKKWRDTKFANNPSLLAKALTDYEKLSGMPEASRPGRYFGFKSVLNAKDEKAEKQLSLLSQRLRKTSDKTVFFTLNLGKLTKPEQDKLLASPVLAHFRYFLERLFLGAKHHLSEKEEKIIKLKSPQAYDRWVSATEKIISNRTVKFKGKTLHLPEALETLDSYKNANDKKKLWTLIKAEMKQIGEVAEHEFNAIITDARSEEELRGFEKPYSSTALSYEDDEKSIENLVSVVSNKGFKLSQKFYKHKAKLHGVKQLHYTQKYDAIGELSSISFEKAVEICRDVFYGLKKEYGEIFDSMLTRGQIDVYPKAGKRGGAFMSDQTGHPVHVFLNHTPSFKSLETLAHEMGHAIHAHRSAKQSPFYDGHSITTAETASTLFENLVFDAMLEQADEKDKVLLLHDRITRDIATIQRQIAFFNCELEIHNTIAKEGGMTNDELRACMQKNLKAYLGSGVEVVDDDGYSYVYIPHLRYGFYVYTYTFGMLMSTKMAENYKKDKSYIEQIDKFLLAGESDNVSNIFKQIGIDTGNKAIFSDALNNHESTINEFIKLTKKK